MSTDTESKPNRGDGYERRDANVGTLLQFGFWLAVVLVIVLFAMKWTFRFLSAKAPMGPPPTPFENARVLPPQPRLQVEPHLDLKTYCDQQLSHLNGYGWVDQHNGVVHIPIDQAMDNLLQQGLPTRAPVAGSAGGEGSTAVAPLGTVEVPTGTGGPCSFLAAPPPRPIEK